MTADSIAPVEADGLTRDYPTGLRGLKVRAVDGLSFRVEPGEVFGLLGPNGSGKSTTLRMLLGILRPTRGRCRLFGEDPGKAEVRARVGFLPESPDFYRFLTGRELVRFYGRICGMDRSRCERRVDAVVERVGLAGAADRPLRTYSKGMLQRIGLAQAIVHEPDLVILDEPTAGMDPIGAGMVAGLVRELRAEGRTVLLCSHLLTQVEAVCDRIAILYQGSLLVCGSLEELFSEGGRVDASIRDWRPELKPQLDEWLSAQGAQLEEVTAPRRRLDRLFMEHVESKRVESEVRTDGLP